MNPINLNQVEFFRSNNVSVLDNLQYSNVPCCFHLWYFVDALGLNTYIFIQPCSSSVSKLLESRLTCFVEIYWTNWMKVNRPAVKMQTRTDSPSLCCVLRRASAENVFLNIVWKWLTSESLFAFHRSMITREGVQQCTRRHGFKQYWIGFRSKQCATVNPQLQPSSDH